MQRRRRTPAVPVKVRKAFLEDLHEGWSVEWAAQRAGVRRQRLYELRAVDEEFAAAWDETYSHGQSLRLDVVKDEIRRRAVEGWEEPVFQKGELVGHVHKFSDVLLIFEAKRLDPSYRDNARVEVTGRDGGPVELAAGYQPATLTDLVALAGELGVLDSLGYRRDEIEGEAVELTEGSDTV